MQPPTLPIRFQLPLISGASFSACSFALYPLTQAIRPTQTAALVVYSCIGAIGAAAALLAIWAVLGSRPNYWFRVLISYGAGLALMGCWLIGFAVSAPHSVRARELRDCTLTILCLPLVFLAIQSPLWFARLAFRWEMVSPSQGLQNFRPLTIRNMLIAMAFVGCGLAAARFASTLGQISGPRSNRDFWIPFGIVLASCFVISLATTLPMVVATLRARHAGLAMVGFSIYAAIAIVITLTVIGLFARRPLRPWDVVILLTVIASFTLAMTMPLLTARRRGYRLRWGREVLEMRIQGSCKQAHSALRFYEE